MNPGNPYGYGGGGGGGYGQPQQPYYPPQQQQQQPYYPPQAQPPAPAPQHGKGMAMLGLALWALGCLFGLAVQVWVFLIQPLGMRNGGSIIVAELIALSFALPACLVYMW